MSGGRNHPARLLLALCLLCLGCQAAAEVLRYFPAGPIYEYRWKLLDLALQHSGGGGTLQAYEEPVTQDRAALLLQAGQIDVLALGTNAEREAQMRPIRIDMLRGIVGYRVFLIRAEDQARIAALDEDAVRKQLVFGLNSQWADLAIMRANGLLVETSAGYDNLFAMLASGRFDAFPRGLNEATRELAERHGQYPSLALERSKALYFPYPVYFWVRNGNERLAKRIEQGLQAALADGSFRSLFEQYHAAEIASLQRQPRQVIRMRNPILPAGNAEPDTSWWWKP